MAVLTEAQVISLPIRALVPREDQPRQDFEEEETRSLADSIRAQGVLEPLQVRRLPGGKYDLLSGHRRRKAAILAGLQEVPCIVRDLDDREADLLCALANLGRVDLLPWEEGQGFIDLHRAHGISYAGIAQRIGRTEAYVSGRVRLAGVCTEAQEAYKSKRLSLEVLAILAKLPNEEVAVKNCVCGAVNSAENETCEACGRDLAGVRLVVQDNPQRAAVRHVLGVTPEQARARVGFIASQYGLASTGQTAMLLEVAVESPEVVAVRGQVQDLLGRISRLGERVLEKPEAISRLRREQREAIAQQAASAISILQYIQRAAQ